LTTSYSPDEMQELLLAGARADGWLPAQAAAHLLVFTGLPGCPPFAAHVEIRDAWSLGDMVRGAWVQDWDALLADEDLYLTGTERRFLEVAASFAAGRKISLSGQVTGELGWAHAQRVAEAIFIATGTAGLLQVTGTAKLGEGHERSSRA
jgi:hypothetical protein